MRDINFLTTIDFTGTHNGEEELPGGRGATAQSELQRVGFAAASTRNGVNSRCLFGIYTLTIGSPLLSNSPHFFLERKWNLGERISMNDINVDTFVIVYIVWMNFHFRLFYSCFS